ncbi:MAG: carbohydrate porin [Hyphomicrobiales bacterium]
MFGPGKVKSLLSLMCCFIASASGLGQANAQSTPAQIANSGPTTQQLFDEALDKASEFDATGWPPQGRTTLSQSFTDAYVEFNRQLWVDHSMFYLFAPTFMVQQSTQGGPKDFTANAQYQGLFGWRMFHNTPVGTGYFIFNNLQVKQLTKTTGVDVSQQLGINYFISDSVADVNVIKSLLWRHDLPGDALTLFVGHGEIGSLDGGCRYACDDTTSFISSPLSNNPARTLPGQGAMVSADIRIADNVVLEGTVADALGDGKLDFGRIFKNGDLAYGGAIKFENPFEAAGDGVYKLTYYRVDATRQGTNRAQRASEGLSVQLDQDFGPLGVFIKYHKAFKRQGMIKQTGAAGLMFKEPFGYSEDMAGLGVGWADPKAKNSRNEYVAEAFYRMQLTPFIQATPDAMLIINPSDRTKKDLEAVFTFRVRGMF